MAKWSDLNASAPFGITSQPVGGRPGTAAANPYRSVTRRAGLAATLPDHSPFTPVLQRQRHLARMTVPVQLSTRMAARSSLSQISKQTQYHGRRMGNGLLGFFGKVRK
jgi:hypothetical protein